ncbi:MULTISPECIES: hypothetical protein [Pedobacter]|uniref:hypothetical protein n=1 Tax=Pedobacter TaxID=84567 RepID=UPI0021097E70|nr:MULTISPECIES: hypothetical protein [unclassified Pedobacter]
MERFQALTNQQQVANQDASSPFLIVDSDDTQRIQSLSVMFPRLGMMIKNNRNKNLVLNFRDEKQRSLIIMVVCKPPVEMAS